MLDVNELGSAIEPEQPRTRRQQALAASEKARADIARLVKSGDERSAFLIACATIDRIAEVLR